MCIYIYAIIFQGLQLIRAYQIHGYFWLIHVGKYTYVKCGKPWDARVSFGTLYIFVWYIYSNMMLYICNMYIYIYIIYISYIYIYISYIYIIYIYHIIYIYIIYISYIYIYHIYISYIYISRFIRLTGGNVVHNDLHGVTLVWSQQWYLS